eukprot:6210276-Pleurochrysis_carterae.AAC.2
MPKSGGSPKVRRHHHFTAQASLQTLRPRSIRHAISSLSRPKFLVPTLSKHSRDACIVEYVGCKVGRGDKNKMWEYIPKYLAGI